MNPLQSLNMADLQAVLLKAIETGGVAPLIKQDLEIEAHNQLYEETSNTEMTLLKDIARVPAKQILHEFSVIKGYGAERARPFIAETGIPTYSKASYERRNVNIKLVAEYASVTLLAALEASISARGSSDQTEIEAKGKRSLLMHKLNREIYFSNPDTTRSTLPFRGLLALLGDYTSIASGHFIDLRGKKLTPDIVRQGAKLISTYHGSMRALYMSVYDKTNLEGGLDAAERLFLNQSVQGQNSLIIGQVIDGMVTEGGPCYFRVDNGLTPRHALFTPPDNADPDQFPDGVPDPLGTITPADGGTPSDSQFVSGDAAADWIFRVTALNETGESQYVDSAPFTVAAGHAYTATFAQRSTDYSYRIYRGSAIKTAGIFGLVAEVKADGNTSNKVFTDKNAVIPGTRIAFGLNVNTNNFRQTRPVELRNPALPGNTLALVELAPMSVFELAKLFLVVSNENRFPRLFLRWLSYPRLVWMPLMNYPPATILTSENLQRRDSMTISGDIFRTEPRKKEIPGHLGYFASEDGLIYSRRFPEKPLRQHTDTNGYLSVFLFENGKHKARRVHRLILETFVGKRPPGMEACHGPGGKHDDSLKNLSWGTSLKNNRDDKLRDGKLNRGERQGHSKLKEEDVRTIRALKGVIIGRDVAKRFNVSPARISDIQNRKSWAWLK